MNKSESIKALAAALHKAQMEIKSALKESENPYFKSKYADLKAIWGSCKEALKNNELSITQTGKVEGSQMVLETTLLHTSGEYITGEYIINPSKPNDPQQIASAWTYGRRYSISALLGIVSDVDDDGEGATDHGDSTVPKKQSFKEKIQAYNNAHPEPLMAPEPIKAVEPPTLSKTIPKDEPWSSDSVLSLEELVTTIQAVSEKSGKKPFGVKTSKGEWFNTWDDALADYLREAHASKEPVKLVLELKGKYKNIIDASKAEIAA